MQILEHDGHEHMNPLEQPRSTIFKIMLYLSVISSDHSVDASSSNKDGSVLEARKFHHCGSLFVVPVSAEEDPFEYAGLPPLDAV